MKPGRALVILAVLAAAAGGWLVARDALSDRRFGPEQPFDSALWKAHADCDEVRLGMVRDLLKRHPLKGRSRTEVEALLGPPLSGDHKFADRDMVYCLSPQRGMPIDFEWLLIDLDAEGRVERAEITPD